MDALDIAQCHLRYALSLAKLRADEADDAAKRAHDYLEKCQRAMNDFLLNKYPKEAA